MDNNFITGSFCPAEWTLPCQSGKAGLSNIKALGQIYFCEYYVNRTTSMTIIQTTTDTKFTAWMLLNLEYYHLKLHSSLEKKKTPVHKPFQCSDKKHSPWQGICVIRKTLQEEDPKPFPPSAPYNQMLLILYAPESTITHCIVSYLFSQAQNSRTSEGKYPEET